jgi:hypothetical protein
VVAAKARLVVATRGRTNVFRIFRMFRIFYKSFGFLLAVATHGQECSR